MRSSPCPIALALLGLLAPLATAQYNGSLMFVQGKLAFEGGRFKAAGQAFSQAGKAGYPPQVIHDWMGRVYENLGRYDRAIIHFKKALKTGLDTEGLWLKIADLQLQLHQSEDALESLGHLPPSYERRPEFLLIRGAIYVRHQRPKQAYDDLLAAVEAYPHEVFDAAELLPEHLRDPLLARIDERLDELAEIASRPAPRTTVVNPLTTTGPVSTGRTRFSSEFLKKKKTASGTPYQLFRGGNTGQQTGTGIGHVLERRESQGTSVTN